MNTQPDFKELLKLLEENKTRYMIIGGYAVAYHGYPRFTKDIDIFFHNSEKNTTLIYDVLISFGFNKNDIDKKELKKKGNIIQFGIEPVRIDLLNDIDGISFAEAEKNIVRGMYDDVEVNFIGKSDLLKNKKASGRSQDIADSEALE